MSLKYLLDTNVISDLMRPAPNPIIFERVNLLTNNVADFQYFENLKIDNWFDREDSNG
jgi:predicted nucleic acid-binding protein